MINNKEFSIKETVNRNIEKHQFPHYKNHNSLIGWCTMNYPKVLQNPKLIPKPEPRDDDYDKQKKQELRFQYQVRQKHMQQGVNFKFKKPFQTFDQHGVPVREETVGQPPDGFKTSCLTLTTTDKEAKTHIVNEANKNNKFSSIYPLSNEIPKNTYDENFSRKIRQIGEISYQTSYEGEDQRHLKKLPNSVLTEQNLLEIMTPELQYMNLQNHTWIPNDLISKIGYFATNILELNLSATQITDPILKELAISCEKLNSIDISKCTELTSEGIVMFLDKKKEQLVKFCSAYNNTQITDESVSDLKYADKLQHINLSFCTQITDQTLSYLDHSKVQLKQIHFSSCDNIQDKYLYHIINNSRQVLTHCDLSFNLQKEIGKKVCTALGNCAQLKELVLTGCINVADDSIGALTACEDPQFKPDGFTKLEILKLGGNEQVTDTVLGRLFQISPNLKYAELNNLEKLSEYTLNAITKYCSQLQKVSLNFTPNIEEEVLQQFKDQFPHISFNRKINQSTDVKDDGLRMPYPLESKLKIKPKKKKKK